MPSKDGDPISALLETVHRDGGTYGRPGAMQSAGNLSTAALTLFLALRLSVDPDLPWPVLDDPVQSMDDLHVAQFAALLRTLAKREERQVIIAIHERQLFDYLTLELSPAFPGDKLIAVEIPSAVVLDGSLSQMNEAPLLRSVQRAYNGDNRAPRSLTARNQFRTLTD